MLPLYGITHCYGRGYPRAPRGVSIGCLNNNWPAAWKRVSGPAPSGVWLPFLTEHAVYESTGSDADSIANRWVWIAENSEHNIQVLIENTTYRQQFYTALVHINDAGGGGAFYRSEDLPWGNPATIICPYRGGLIPGWANQTADLVIGRALYEDLTPDWCELP